MRYSNNGETYVGRRRPARVVGLMVAGLLLAGCTGGATGSSDGGAADAEAAAVDVSNLEPVPPVELITKTAAEDPDRFEASRLIVDAWNAAGIEAELLPVDSALLSERTFGGKNFDTYFISYGPTADRLDPANLLGRLITASAGETGNNVSGYMNVRYDELYQAQATASSPDQRREAVMEMQELAYQHLPVRPIFHPVVGAAYRSDRWTGISPAVGNPLFNIWNAIEAEPVESESRLTIGTSIEPPTLNPTLVDTLEAQLPLSLIYDSLFRVGRSGDLVPWAAEDMTVDGSTVTLTLRQGMEFHDGQPVTAADVAFSVQYLVEHESPAYASKLANVSEVAAPDESTVTIELAEPSSSFPTVALASMPILPQHVWEDVDDPAQFANEDPVGSGPFRFGSHEIGASVRFDANETHFAAPTVAGIDLVVLGSFDAGIGALGTGEIDLLDDVQNAVNFEPLEGRDDVTVVKTESHGWRGLHFNMRKAPFDDRHFRRALSLIIPTDDIIDVIVNGNGAPAGSVIAPTLTEWTNSDLGPYETDVDKAMEELEAAGYVFGDDGTLYYPSPNNDNRVFDNDADQG